MARVLLENRYRPATEEQLLKAFQVSLILYSKLYKIDYMYNNSKFAHNEYYCASELVSLVEANSLCSFSQLMYTYSCKWLYILICMITITSRGY